MSANAPVDRDERTTALENVGYRWGYMLLTYVLLVDVAARSLLRREQPWDLLAFVVVGGILMGVYQARRGLLTRRWAIVAFTALAVGAVAAAAAAGMVSLHWLQ